MNKANYEKLKKEKTIVKGKVNVLTTTTVDNKTVRALGINLDGDKKNTILISTIDLFLPKSGRSLKSMVGTEIDFRIKDVKSKDKNLFITGERVSVLREKKDALIKELEKNPDKVYKAKIKKLLEHGAYLMIDDIDVFMYNSAFAEGYIPVNAVKNIGDELEVQFNKYSENNDIIYVKMKEKYKEEIVLDLKEVKPQDIMKGVVRTKTSNLCFVNISPMIDVLCSPVEGFEIGDEALVKITGFKEENGRTRVRGKILISKFSDDFKL